MHTRSLSFVALTFVVLATPAARASFSDNLLAYWNADSVSGNLLTANGGSLASAAAVTELRNDYYGITGALPTPVAGKFGNALDVSVQSGAVNGSPKSPNETLSNLSQLMPGTGDWTMSFWFRSAALSASDQKLFSFGATTDSLVAGQVAPGISLTALGGTGSVFGNFQLAVGTTTDATRTKYLSGSAIAGFWDGATFHHFAVIRSGTSLGLYVDGSLAVSNASAPLVSGYDISTTATTIFRELTLGPEAAATGAAMDDIAIWNRALSTTEVSQLYNGGTGATVASLAAVPEPSAYGFVAGAGAVVTAFRMRRRRHIASAAAAPAPTRP